MIERINAVLAVVFFCCYFYQFIYILIRFLKKKKTYPPAPFRHYAILIAARNEEAVIGKLIDSIRAQSYPMDHVEIFVVADNCTDNTAEVARAAGAHVYERFNRMQVGKGYAMEYLLDVIDSEWGWESFDGYFVFDADNLLDEHYLEEMNRVIGSGYQAVTSYRNSKNYGDNWISAGYSLWFLRDAEFMNHARMLLDTDSVITGTGFYLSSELIRKYGGWKWFLLTEDTELTVRLILDGVRIGYCADAIFYDEQPTDFKQSWTQRMRWAKGFLQVVSHYGKSLVGGIFKNGSFACYDILMAVMPAMVLGIAGTVLNVAVTVAGGLTDAGVTALVLAMLKSIGSTYLLMLLIGGVTLFSQWKRISCSAAKKVGYLFTFPIFVMTYMPIAVAALFARRVEWKPIRHTSAKSLAQLKQEI